MISEFGPLGGVTFVETDRCIVARLINVIFTQNITAVDKQVGLKSAKQRCGLNHCPVEIEENNTLVHLVWFWFGLLFIYLDPH